MMKNRIINYLFTSVSALFAIVLSLYVQLNGQKNLDRCSYLDPVIVDILALSAGIFLVIEGLYKIIKHRDDLPLYNFTRVVRVAFGCAIITLHIIHFLHK